MESDRGQREELTHKDTHSLCYEVSHEVMFGQAWLGGEAISKIDTGGGDVAPTPAVAYQQISQLFACVSVCAPVNTSKCACMIQPIIVGVHAPLNEQSPERYRRPVRSVGHHRDSLTQQSEPACLTA